MFIEWLKEWIKDNFAWKWGHEHDGNFHFTYYFEDYRRVAKILQEIRKHGIRCILSIFKRKTFLFLSFWLSLNITCPSSFYPIPCYSFEWNYSKSYLPSQSLFSLFSWSLEPILVHFYSSHSIGIVLSLLGIWSSSSICSPWHIFFPWLGASNLSWFTS